MSVTDAPISVPRAEPVGRPRLSSSGVEQARNHLVAALHAFGDVERSIDEQIDAALHALAREVEGPHPLVSDDQLKAFGDRVTTVRRLLTDARRARADQEQVSELIEQLHERRTDDAFLVHPGPDPLG